MNEQKGPLLALTALTLALLPALPIENRAAAFIELDQETEAARTSLLNSRAEEELLASFEQTIAALNALRAQNPD